MERSILAVLAMAIFAVPGIASADLSTGLVVHYDFDGDADDQSVNGHDGTVYGATLTVDRFGNANSAYHFDGIDDYIDMNVRLGGYPAFSEFAWVRAITLKTRNNFIQSSNWYVNDTKGNDGGFDLAISNGYIKSWVNQPDRTAHSVLAGPYVVLGKWHLIGSTWDGSTHRLYFDGDEVASGAYAGYIGTSAKNSLIGTKYYGSGFNGYLNGDIDDVRIYNRALTASEVSELNVVPVPGAFLLGSIGLAFAGWKLRRRKYSLAG